MYGSSNVETTEAEATTTTAPEEGPTSPGTDQKLSDLPIAH